MKTLHFLLPTLLLVGAPVWAVEPVVVGPRSFKRDTPGVYKVPAGKGKLSLEEIDGVVVLRRPGELIVVGPPGEYVLRGAWFAENWEESDIIRFPFKIEGTPDPKPPTPPGPNPGPTPTPDPLGLAAASRDGLAKVSETADRIKLRDAQLSHAAAVAAGAFPDAPAILDAWRKANNSAAAAAAWKPWAEAVSARLKTVYADGKLKTNAEWADAFRSIASGLGN